MIGDINRVIHFCDHLHKKVSWLLNISPRSCLKSWWRAQFGFDCLIFVHSTRQWKPKNNPGWKSRFCIYFSVMIPFFFVNFKRRMLPDVWLSFNATVTPVSGGRRLSHDQRWLWFFFAMNLQSRCLWNICFKDGQQVSLAVSCCLEVVIKWHEDRTSQLSF